VTDSGIHRGVAEEKDDDVERLRRILAVMHERRPEPSRLKKIMERLRTRKIGNGVKDKKKTGAA